MRMLGTHTLAYPIIRETKDPAIADQVNEEELKPAGFCVTMRRPKARDLDVFDQHQATPMKALRLLLSRIANLDAEEVELLDVEDFEALGELLPERSRAGPTPGATG